MNWRLLLTTGFGLGLLRPGPGTWGSLPPVGLALAVVWWFGPGMEVNIAVGALGLAFALACIKLGWWAERRFLRKDPPQVVADEIAGQALPLLFLPWETFGPGDAARHNLILAGLAFALFRVIDIAKPPPIKKLQIIPGGWGILIDDLVAGAFALVVVQVIVRFVP